MFLMFLESSFLRLFADNVDPDNWDDTAMSWVITAIVVAILGAGIIFAVKAARKSMADIARKKIWTRGQTWLLIFIGIFPIFIAMWIIWYMQHDFLAVIQIGGLIKGTFFAWLLYVFVMVIGHLVGPWRRELI
jgi:H+/Cl- antiporter ClcA